MAQLPLDDAVERFQQNEERIDKFVNAPDGYFSSTGEAVESLPAFLARQEQEIEQTTGTVAANLAASEAARADAEAARADAEAARDAAIVNSPTYPDEPTGRAAVADGAYFKVQGSGDIAAYEYRRVSASSSTLVATYPAIQAYDALVTRIFQPGSYSANERACVKCIGHVEITRLLPTSTGYVSLLKLTTGADGKPTEVNVMYASGAYLVLSKASEDTINGFEVWVGSVSNNFAIAVWVDVKRTPVSFTYVDSNYTTNRMKFQELVNRPEKVSHLYSEQYLQYIEFVDSGVYGADGNVTGAYGGYHKAVPVTKPGFYQIGWTCAGTVRCMHAVDGSGTILQTWTGDYFENVHNKVIDVPPGTSELRLSSYSDTAFSPANPKDGFLIHSPKAFGPTYGLVSEEQIEGLVADASLDDAPYIDLVGNMWTDGAWRNNTDTSAEARVYALESGETYELMFAPTTGLVPPEQALSTLSITSQLVANQSFSPMTHNGSLFENLGPDCDSVTVNGYTRQGYIAAAWTPPAGAKSLIVQIKWNNEVVPGIRLYKRKGAKSIYSQSNNANKRIAICGDSVAADPGGEIGKEHLRNLLGCTVHTYAVPGAGFCYNATPTWITPNRVSGIMQVEELVKTATQKYDIYLLSGTLNDPVTHNKAIGSITHCRPYLKVDGLPDFTDPNLDTMLGALNFCIQRIYEKNPKAKIVLSTMGKIFLTSPTSGFDTDAGYNINDTSTNSSGATYYQYVQAIRLLGESWGIPVVDVYAKAGINEFNKAATMLDAYHPTNRGYEGIWNLWFEAVLNS